MRLVNFPARFKHSVIKSPSLDKARIKRKDQQSRQICLLFTFVWANDFVSRFLIQSHFSESLPPQMKPQKVKRKEKPKGRKKRNRGEAGQISVLNRYLLDLPTSFTLDDFRVLNLKLSWPIAQNSNQPFPFSLAPLSDFLTRPTTQMLSWGAFYQLHTYLHLKCVSHFWANTDKWLAFVHSISWLNCSAREELSEKLGLSEARVQVGFVAGHQETHC